MAKLERLDFNWLIISKTLESRLIKESLVSSTAKKPSNSGHVGEVLWLSVKNSWLCVGGFGIFGSAEFK